MKNRLLTKVIAALGTLILFGSYVRWVMVYDDLSSAAFGMVIGIILLGTSFVYQRLSELADDVQDLRRGLDLQNEWIRDEIKKFGGLKLDEK